MKRCSKCKQELPLSCFGKHTKSKDGLKESCKICRKQEAKNYYLHKDKQKHLLETLKGRAKQLNLPFNLEYEDLTPPEVCPVFGTTLVKIDPYSNQSTRFSMSVDRIIPELGYVKGNIQIISQLANVMKHDASKEELLLFANWVYKTYKD